MGLVGQPQCLLVELLLQLSLSGVQGCELLPDFPATGPQALILGVLDRAKRVTLGRVRDALLEGPHADTRHFFLSSNPSFLSTWQDHEGNAQV